MRIRISGLFLRLVFLTAALLYVSGCAQQMQSVQSEPLVEPSANAVINSIQFSDDASTIVISTDRPIVYTYYMLDAPPRLIVDLAQTTSGALIFPIDVNKGNIKKIDVSRHEFGGGVLSRVEVALIDKVEATAALDSQNRTKLVLKLEGQKASGTVAQEVAEKVSTTPPAAGTATAPATEVATVAVPAAPEIEPAAVPVATETPSAATGKETVADAKPAALPAPEPELIVAPVAVTEPAAVVSSPQGEPRAEVKPEPQSWSKALPAGSPRSLTAITAKAESIDIEISSPVESFKTFKLSQPDRLVLDIAKTRNLIASKQVDVNRFNLGKARIGGTAEKLRIVFDAAGGVVPPYQVLKSGNGLQIVFGEKAVGQKAASAAPVPATLPAAAPSPPSAARGGSVDAIEFTQSDGFSLITVRTSGSCSASGPVKSGKGAQLTLTLKGCRLPAKLQRSLVTTGFESVIKEIAPYPVKTKKGAEARIAVKMTSMAPYQLKQDGNVWQLEFREPVKPVKITRPAKTPKPIASQESGSAPAVGAVGASAGIEREFADSGQEPAKPKAEKALDEVFALDKAASSVNRPSRVYTGRKVSLEFSDADIRKIFQLIAEVSNQNFLVSDDVTGTISLKLVNVPWDQALEVILENKGLGMQKDGNIVQIRPKSKMKSLDDEAIEMRITEEKKLPLSTVIFDINFATLGDIEKQFRNLKSRRADATIASDIRTNKIIVVDIDPNIKKMRKLLESLDVPEKQVMIEARIVEATSDFTRAMGVQWGFGYQDGSASVANINNITGSMGGVVVTGAASGGLATGISFGKLMSNIQLDMRLSASASMGQTKIISTPRVMTVNNKAAKITSGTMVPYQNTSSAEGAKTEFVEAALSLEVTPHITADGSVSMKIKASNNSVGSTGSPPPINKQEATTELVLRNGETTVIGGIYKDNEGEGDIGVPYLSDIPLLGWLFKSNQKTKTRSELLIFITPKIMN